MVPPQGGRKHPEQKLIKVNTKDILFIVSGAFVGLEDIIYDRLNEDYENGPKIGFGSIQKEKSKIELQDAIDNLDALSKKIIAENLIAAGKE